MDDPYRLPGTEPVPAPPVVPRRAGALRPLLWVALVVSAAANAVLSSTGRPVAVAAGFGLLALASAVALVGLHRRRTR